MKLVNIPRAFGFVSLNLQIIEKKYYEYPTKNNADLLDPKPFHPQTELAVQPIGNATRFLKPTSA